MLRDFCSSAHLAGTDGPQVHSLPMLRAYLTLPGQVYVLCIGTFINRAGTFLVPFLTLYLANELGFGMEFAGVGLSVYGMGSLAGALCGGHLADRFGRRGVMIAALCGGAAVLSVFGELRSPLVILAALALFPLLGEMYRPAANAMVADLVPPGRRAYAFGLMYVAINLGFAVGPALGGWIQERYSFQWLFWGDAVTCAVYALIILAFVRETKPAHALPSQNSPGAGGERLSAPAAGTMAEDDGRSALRRILADRTFVIFCLATLLVGLGYMQCMSTFPLYLDRALGMGGAAYGRIIAVNGVMIVVCQIPLTAMLKRFDRAGVIALSGVFAGVGFGTTMLARTEWQLMLTVMLWTVGEMMSAAFSAAVVSDLAPPALRARYMGAFSMCFSSATMLGAPLGGLVLEHWGGRALWASCLVAGLAAAVLYYSIHRQIGSPPAIRPASGEEVPSGSD